MMPTAAVMRRTLHTRQHWRTIGFEPLFGAIANRAEVAQNPTICYFWGPANALLLMSSNSSLHRTTHLECLVRRLLHARRAADDAHLHQYLRHGRAVQQQSIQAKRDAFLERSITECPESHQTAP